MIGSLALLALGTLWNPEFGAFAYLSYLLFLVYAQLGVETRPAGGARASMMLRALGYRVGMALVIVLGVWGGYALIIRLAYGAFPALTKMFSSLRVFSVLGFNMLPMPGIHPWNLVALVLLVGMAISLFALLMRSATPRHAMVLLIALQGMGQLFYYQGRSHNWNLVSALVYVFVLVGIFCDSLLQIAQRDKLAGFPPPCSCSFCWLLLFKSPAAGDEYWRWFPSKPPRSATPPSNKP